MKNPPTNRGVLAACRVSAAAGLLALMFVTTANAQLGTGWSQYSPSKSIHLDGSAGLQIFSWSSYQSVDSPISADYRYDSSTDTETFRILDSRSNRSEIRLHNEYTTGKRQLQGYLTFNSPLEDESLTQIFGSSSGATLVMTRGYASSNGHITATSTGGGTRFGSTTIASNCYGVELRINIIHKQDDGVEWYVNGSLKCIQNDTETGIANYHKYGCYGTTNGNVPAVVKWRAFRSYQNGNSPLGGFYKIIARNSGKALVVQSASLSNSANVIQWDYTSADPSNDEWEMVDLGTGYYKILNRNSGKAMVVQSASTSAGALVIQYDFGGSNTNDEWQLVDLGTGYFKVVNHNSGLVLDVKGNSTANGAQLEQWTANGQTNQQFQFVSVP